MKAALISILAFIISGCVFYPKQVAYYDAECKITAKKLVLKSSDPELPDNCNNEGCFAAALLMTSASAIVSGSIVVAGNIVYWLEKEGRCERNDSAVKTEQAL